MKSSQAQVMSTASMNKVLQLNKIPSKFYENRNRNGNAKQSNSREVQTTTSFVNFISVPSMLVSVLLFIAPTGPEPPDSTPKSWNHMPLLWVLTFYPLASAFGVLRLQQYANHAWLVIFKANVSKMTKTRCWL